MHLEQRTKTATRFSPAGMSALAILVATIAAEAPAEMLFLSCPQQVLKIIDLNGDGDALDFGEVSAFADALSEDISAICYAADKLFVVDPDDAAIIVIQDKNGDGDAMDVDEVRTFADLSPWLNANTPLGLAVDDAGTLYTLDAEGGRLLRLADLNHDGDALDAGEVAAIAENLDGALAISCRADTSILVAMDDYNAPVRILNDRNGDDDFLDFAENLSYAACFVPGIAISAMNTETSLLARNTEPHILKLVDTNGDGDAMDFGEITAYAQLAPPVAAITNGGTPDLYVAAGLGDYTVFQVRDLNGDGDAFDAGEVAVFASGLPPIRGMTIRTSGCLPGDVDGSGTLDMTDVADFVEIVLGLAPPTDLCRADLNNDGCIDGGDIAPFVERMLE